MIYFFFKHNFTSIPIQFQNFTFLLFTYICKCLYCAMFNFFSLGRYINSLKTLFIYFKKKKIELILLYGKKKKINLNL